MSYFFYLSERKQAVRINNNYSSLRKIISGVPQGSILGPIFFNVFMNDMFCFMNNASLHNYADDNTISAYSNTLSELVKILENESEIAINWLRINKMIVNPAKFQAMIVSKGKQNFQDIKLEVNNQKIKVEENIKLLGVTIDHKLKFDNHIKQLVGTAAKQLNALFRLNNYIGTKEKEALINSFIYSNFDYCPLVWHFTSAKSLEKIENIQKRALRFMYNDYQNSYEYLLIKAEKSTMTVRRLRFLCIEIFKTINDLNPPYMKTIFKLAENKTKPVRSQYKWNLEIPRVNKVTFGNKSLRSLGPKIWNNLPSHLKSSNNLNTFKHLIKKWDGISCHCNVCSSL